MSCPVREKSQRVWEKLEAESERRARERLMQEVNGLEGRACATHQGVPSLCICSDSRLENPSSLPLLPERLLQMELKMQENSQAQNESEEVGGGLIQEGGGRGPKDGSDTGTANRGQLLAWVRWSGGRPNDVAHCSLSPAGGAVGGAAPGEGEGCSKAAGGRVEDGDS